MLPERLDLEPDDSWRISLYVSVKPNGEGQVVVDKIFLLFFLQETREYKR